MAWLERTTPYRLCTSWVSWPFILPGNAILLGTRYADRADLSRHLAPFVKLHPPVQWLAVIPHLSATHTILGHVASPHCAAIASAMPWYVLLRSFHLSGDGGSLFCPLAV